MLYTSLFGRKGARRSVGQSVVTQPSQPEAPIMMMPIPAKTTKVVNLFPHHSGQGRGWTLE